DLVTGVQTCALPILLIAGGTDGTSNLGSALKYDAGAASPAATGVSAMAQPRASFTGTLLGNGKVLIVGGAAGDLSAELFDAGGRSEERRVGKGGVAR